MIYKILLSKRNCKSEKALFIDRDGVINKNPPQHDYVKSWDEFRFNDGVFEILKIANAKKFQVIVITNQRGIGREIYSDKTFRTITKRMAIFLKSKGLYLNAVYYCPHEVAESCNCRKPKPGLFIQAINDHKIKPELSIMLGDTESDKKAALLAGIGKVILVKQDLDGVCVADNIFMS